jgi:hypothetical protein
MPQVSTLPRPKQASTETHQESERERQDDGNSTAKDIRRKVTANLI